jgi:hypothetical protein
MDKSKINEENPIKIMEVPGFPADACPAGERHQEGESSHTQKRLLASGFAPLWKVARNVAREFPCAYFTKAKLINLLHRGKEKREIESLEWRGKEAEARWQPWVDPKEARKFILAYIAEWDKRHEQKRVLAEIAQEAEASKAIVHVEASAPAPELELEPLVVRAVDLGDPEQTVEQRLEAIEQCIVAMADVLDRVDAKILDPDLESAAAASLEESLRIHMNANAARIDREQLGRQHIESKLDKIEGRLDNLVLRFAACGVDECTVQGPKTPQR